MADDATKPAAADNVGDDATDSTGTDAGEDTLANQLYSLPAYRESYQGMCSRSESLGSIVVCPSLMLPSQDQASRDTETELHQEKDVTKENHEKGDHKDVVPENYSEEEENNKLYRRLCFLRN